MKTADMPVSLRQATHADIPLLIKARFDFLRALGYPIIAEELPEASLLIESFLSEHLNRDIYAWIGLEGETIAAAGFLQVYQVMWQPKAPKGRFGRIINVLTWQEYRRQGLAREIMQVLIQKARELDLAYLDLDASPEGRPLYESLGFRLVHTEHPPMRLFLSQE